MFLFRLTCFFVRRVGFLIGVGHFSARLRDRRSGDGDSFYVIRGRKAYHLRILGIDAPEFSQPFGKRSSQKRISLCSSGNFRVKLLGKDCYGRHLATVRLRDGSDLGRTLVRGGFAYNTGNYPIAEWSAKSKKLGIWGMRKEFQVRPWVYRNHSEA